MRLNPVSIDHSCEAVCCQDNNLSLNVIKTKEMLVKNRKKRTEHSPILGAG
jgi:hypothetical protein